MHEKKLRYPNLREAMTAIQNERMEEIGQHTWLDLVEQYGQAILFAEIASIVSRLRAMFWEHNPYSDIYMPESQVDRALDLLIDLGNYTEFLYIAVQDEEERLNKQMQKDIRTIREIGKKVRAKAEGDGEAS